MAEENPRRAAVFSSLSDIVGAVGVVGGILYAVGLAIVNIDLGRYGVAWLNLARPEYVLAGSLWLLLIASTLGISELVLRRPRYLLSSYNHRPLRRSVQVTDFLLDLVVMTIVAVIIVFVLQSESAVKFNTLRAVVIPSTAVALMSVTIRSGYLKFRRKHGRHLGSLTAPFTDGNPASMARILALPIGFILSAGFYAFYVFPWLPMELGGGIKPVVQLTLSERMHVPWSALGILVSDDGQRTGPVRLVLQSDQMIVVSPLGMEPSTLRMLLPQGGTSIWLDRKVVTGVVYVDFVNMSTFRQQLGAFAPNLMKPDTGAMIVGNWGRLSANTLCAVSAQVLDQITSPSISRDPSKRETLIRSERVFPLLAGVQVAPIDYHAAQLDGFSVLVLKGVGLRVLDGARQGQVCWTLTDQVLEECRGLYCQ